MNILPLSFFSLPAGPTPANAASSSVDYLLRLEIQQGEITLSGAETKALASAVMQHVESATASMSNACVVLGSVIDRLKVREAYNLHYRDYLLGHVSEAEFETVAENFAYTPRHIPPTILAADIAVLLKYTTEEFTASEVAELFQTPEPDVEAVVGQLPLPLIGGTTAA